METIHTGAAHNVKVFYGYPGKSFFSYNFETKEYAIYIDAGMKGEEPSNVLKDTAEFYARKGKLEELEKPVLKHFYACVQYWCNEAYRQGKETRNHG